MWQRKPRVAATSSEPLDPGYCHQNQSHSTSGLEGTHGLPHPGFLFLHMGTPGPREGKGGQGNTGGRAWVSKPLSLPICHLPRPATSTTTPRGLHGVSIPLARFRVDMIMDLTGVPGRA